MRWDKSLIWKTLASVAVACSHAAEDKKAKRKIGKQIKLKL